MKPTLRLSIEVSYYKIVPETESIWTLFDKVADLSLKSDIDMGGCVFLNGNAIANGRFILEVGNFYRVIEDLREMQKKLGSSNFRVEWQMESKSLDSFADISYSPYMRSPVHKLETKLNSMDQPEILQTKESSGMRFDMDFEDF